MVVLPQWLVAVNLIDYNEKKEFHKTNTILNQLYTFILIWEQKHLSSSALCLIPNEPRVFSLNDWIISLIQIYTYSKAWMINAYYSFEFKWVICILNFNLGIIKSAISSSKLKPCRNLCMLKVLNI